MYTFLLKRYILNLSHDDSTKRHKLPRALFIWEVCWNGSAIAGVFFFLGGGGTTTVESGNSCKGYNSAMKWPLNAPFGTLTPHQYMLHVSKKLSIWQRINGMWWALIVKHIFFLLHLWRHSQVGIAVQAGLEKSLCMGRCWDVWAAVIPTQKTLAV